MMAAARRRSRPKTRAVGCVLIGGSRAPSRDDNQSRRSRLINIELGALDPPEGSTSFFLAMPDHFAFPGSLIHAGEMFFQAAFQQRPMRNVHEIFGDEPDVFLGGHPMLTKKTREIHRRRVTPQSAFAAQVEVDVEVTEGQLAQRPINRLAITA